MSDFEEACKSDDFEPDEKIAEQFKTILKSSSEYWNIWVYDRNSLFICCLKYITRYQLDNPKLFQRLKEYTLNLLLNNKQKFSEILTPLNQALNQKLVDMLKKLTTTRSITAFNVSWYSQKNDLLTIQFYLNYYLQDSAALTKSVEDILENDTKWSSALEEFKEQLKCETERNKGECPICYAKVPKKKLFCGHSLCENCISHIADKCCPFCREKIQTSDNFKIIKKEIMCEVWLQPEEVVNFLPLYNNLRR